ncbi:MAG: hypothetical protein CL681_24485 [Blastopirellula sp.]|nr:hypothetical protein [Blastopirellula sp.]
MSDPNQDSPAGSSLTLIADAPITSARFDRLDRMAFVRSFAEAIRAVKDADSVVLALAGPWGSGKSSLLNLIGAELVNTSGDTPPLIMRFNPWWFTGSDQLVAAFLQQLSAAVSRPEVRDTFGDASTALAGLAEAIGAPGQISEATGVPNDIEMLRENIISIFRNANRRVLIFMDDIDRLTPEEMTQLLLIVRAVADFPNTTYVMSFDYEVVVEAIANKLGVDGRTYLEKVVLLQIDVPMPGRMSLEQMVLGQLEAIAPVSSSLDTEAQRHFRLLFEGGVKHFLATPRACTRFLNVLRFTYPSLEGQVYLPDMVGISCLMSFSSQAIQAIRSFTTSFVGHCDPTGAGWIRMREFHQSWLSRVSERDRAAVENIVRTLFPKVAWALNGPLRGEEFIEIWDHQKRICAVKHFDSYFRLGLTTGEAAERKSQNIVELLDGATSFARVLQRFGPLDEGQEMMRIGDLLEQATDFVNEQATSEQACSFFQEIIRRGDEIAALENQTAAHALILDDLHRVVSLLVTCLLRIESPQQRRKILLESAEGDAGLLTTAELLDVLDYRCDIFADGKTAPTAESNTAILMEVLRVLDKRIEAASKNGELAQHPRCLKIVQRWYQFGRKATAQTWIREQCSEDEQLVRMLLQGTAVTPETPEDQPFPLPISAEILRELFRKRQLRTRCEAMLDSEPAWLSHDGKRAVQTLLQRL